MRNTLYDHGFGSIWNDVYVEKKERYKTSVADFHEHDFYEIHLILSGNVKVFIGNQTAEGTESKIVFASPNTPHFVTCKPDALYSSIYLVFTKKFIDCFDIEMTSILSSLDGLGRIYTTSKEQTELCIDIINRIDSEDNLTRKKLLVLYLLSLIGGFNEQCSECYTAIPRYICNALTYINDNYARKLVAREIADAVYISRTVLMTEFKKHTGQTVHEYIVNCRLRNAVRLLSQGKTEHEAAVCSGFCDSGALIRCFKKAFNMTPKQYLR